MRRDVITSHYRGVPWQVVFDADDIGRGVDVFVDGEPIVTRPNDLDLKTAVARARRAIGRRAK